MQPYNQFICPIHSETLLHKNETDSYVCPKGSSYPIINNIPRFVSGKNYASAFGLQWKVYQRTQLDSYTGIPISKERLERIVGGSLEIFNGKKVLEAGCGAGRFTEIMLQSGAEVLAADLSAAVEANYHNCSKFEHYSVIQADVVHLPILPNQFDIVVCVGVIQHTPDPEKTIAALCSYLKPGGFLYLDHYTYGYPTTPVRRFLRILLKRMDNLISLKCVQTLTSFLWPLHRISFRYKNVPGFSQFRSLLLFWSPVVDYHETLPILGEKMLREWAILDTHDTLTDYYKHLRSPEEISEYLSKNLMKDIDIEFAGNGIEVRGVKSSNSPIA